MDNLLGARIVMVLTVLGGYVTIGFLWSGMSHAGTVNVLIIVLSVVVVSLLGMVSYIMLWVMPKQHTEAQIRLKEFLNSTSIK